MNSNTLEPDLTDSGLTTLVVTRFRMDRIDCGAAIRNWQNIQSIARLGPVDILSVGPEAPEKELDCVRDYMSFRRDPASKRSIGTNSILAKIKDLFEKDPPLLRSLRLPEVVAALNRMKAKSYTVAIVEELWLMCYLPELKRIAEYVVFDAHNVESTLAGDLGDSKSRKVGGNPVKKWYRHFLAERFRKSEKYYCQAADRVWVCSTVDRDEFIKRGYVEQADVVPNAIDTDSYKQPERFPETRPWSEKPLLLTYLGMYSYYPNEQAALLLIEKVLPLIKAQGVPVKLTLLGKSPTASMKSAAAGSPDIDITGRVESIQPYLREPSIITLPLLIGSGTRLKILEAFASSRPVISTSKGVEGIEAEDGKHLLIRDSVEDIADAAIAIWKDTDLRVSLCDNAQALVEHGYSLASTYRLIKGAYSSMFKAKSP
ncbi:Glycosyltransferase involved in cell wall bisynthesis [Alteromonadaceae bacterium Bs31]|nr:Glycosyltransferase involved in cell wall bisynthesis [Alteromonadaceae bacterium Bs31]